MLSTQVPYRKILLFILFLSVLTGASAQLCNGSLGDPVVNITFGSGTNFGPPLPVGTTKYNYIPNACPVNGYYTLLSKGVECNYGWHVLSGDHTGNTNGYCMLVDASFDASDFYVDTVNTLCSNTTYEFAAWMMNMKYVQEGTRPNITFSIETINGVVLHTYNSGDIPVEPIVQWKKYGFFFTTPPGVGAVVLRMTNNAPGGDGNDLALDDITFRPCGKLITVNAAGFTGDTVYACSTSSSVYTLQANVAAGYIQPLYQWQLSTDKGSSWNDISGETGTTYQRQPTDTGTFWYRFTVVEALATGSSCRIASRPLVMYVIAKPLINAGPDLQVLKDIPVTIMATAATENLTYLWSPASYINDPTQLNPVITPPADMNYIITATTAYGCIAKDTVAIKLTGSLYIPSAFSPNGDGVNDTWKIPALNQGYKAAMQVFNRYGQLVYEANGKAIEWDGKFKGASVASGIYVYLLKFEHGLIYRGTVTVVR